MLRRICEKLAVRKKYKDLEFIFNNELKEGIGDFSEADYELAEGFKEGAGAYKLKNDFGMAGDGYSYAGQEFLRVGEFSESADCFAKSSVMYKMDNRGKCDGWVLEGRMYAKVLRHEVAKQCDLPEDKCWAVQETRNGR